MAFVEDIVTLPDFRGKGVVSALLSRAREQAVQEHAASVELCVWNFNAEALRFYENHGLKMQYCRMEENLIVEE